MKIQPFTPIIFNNNLQRNKKAENIQNTQNLVYSPIAYRDLTFTAQVCWSPEEFYALPFNKNGMPETMKQYVNADYDDRQHVRPQDVMALVFDDINDAKNLEQVKRIFPDEPLFKNLTDKPNKDARTGILAEIDLMREEGKPLFKNGKDNLGLYILKKIYVEGKTLKEINEDFKKDVSVHYNGLSDITYDTKNAFGIKFPDRSFWKSFTHNRDNFKYVYTPKKPIEKRTSSSQTNQNPKSESTPKNRFSEVKDWEIDRLADALNKGNGRADETRKQLKKSSVRDEASLNFVAKYMGEINSVVLEKLHVSPEMRDFFENSDNITKSQKQKMYEYWQEPERRELRSLIMKDVIRLFFDAYGVDGQNDDFKELIEYAHSIKPNRLVEQEKHNRIQAEYDDLAARLDAEDIAKANEILDKYSELKELVDLNKQLDELRNKIEEETDSMVLVTEDGREFSVGSDLKSEYETLIRKKYKGLPKAFLSKYIKFVNSKQDIPDSYLLSEIVYSNGYRIPESEKFMPKEQMNEYTEKLQDEFYKLNKTDCTVLNQVLAESLSDKLPSEHLVLVTGVGLFKFLNIFKSSPDLTDIFVAKQDEINAKYSAYKKPLSYSEIIRITNNIVEIWKDSNYINAVYIGDGNNLPFVELRDSVAKNLRSGDKKFISKVKDELSNYIKEYGGASRVFLDNSVKSNIKRAYFEGFLVNYSKDKMVESTRLQILASE